MFGVIDTIGDCRALAGDPQRGRAGGGPAHDASEVERLGDLARRRGDGVGAGRLRRDALGIDDGRDRSDRLRPPWRCGPWSRPLRPDIARRRIPPTASPRRRLRRSRSRRRRPRPGSAPGSMIIDSSIWVATTTGLPARRDARVICFCRPGTFSTGSSTPRSPRATIRASVMSRIPGEALDRLGLFHLRHHRGAPAGDLLGLGDVVGPLDERQRDPVGAGVEARLRGRNGPCRSARKSRARCRAR